MAGQWSAGGLFFAVFFPDFCGRFLEHFLLFFSVLDPDPAALDPNPAVSEGLPGKIQPARVRIRVATQVLVHGLQAKDPVLGLQV